MANVNPLLIDWNKVEELVSQARRSLSTFPNNHFVNETIKEKILGKIAEEILLLIAVDKCEEGRP